MLTFCLVLSLFVHVHANGVHPSNCSLLPINSDVPSGLVGNDSIDNAGIEYLRQLQEEQEQLNNSLHALTSHFAQVQFRLKQIIDAPNDNKQVSRRNSLSIVSFLINVYDMCIVSFMCHTSPINKSVQLNFCFAEGLKLLSAMLFYAYGLGYGAVEIILPSNQSHICHNEVRTVYLGRSFKYRQIDDTEEPALWLSGLKQDAFYA